MKITDNISVKIYHNSGDNHRKDRYLYPDKLGWKAPQKEYKRPVAKVEVYKDGNLLGTGVAKCAFEDNFSRAVGRELACSRIIQTLRKEGLITTAEFFKTLQFFLDLPRASKPDPEKFYLLGE